jgi:hypothetical protein
VPSMPSCSSLPRGSVSCACCGAVGRCPGPLEPGTSRLDRLGCVPCTAWIRHGRHGPIIAQVFY